MKSLQSAVALESPAPSTGNPALLRWFPLFFLIVTPLVLCLDSTAMARHMELRPLVNAGALLFFWAFCSAADARLRKLLLVMVPLSYVGELIFCETLGWYRYRLGDIPLYVPFGHAIVYGSGYVLAHYRAVVRRDGLVRRICTAGFALLFAGVALALGDGFSASSGLLFFWLMRRKKWVNLYYLIALCVIYIELLGTGLRCWTWTPLIHGVIPTANPPVGVVFFYAGGDALLVRVVNWLDRKGWTSRA